MIPLNKYRGKEGQSNLPFRFNRITISLRSDKLQLSSFANEKETHIGMSLRGIGWVVRGKFAALGGHY